MEIVVVIINLSSCVHLKNILLVENSLFNDLKIINTTKINNIIKKNLYYNIINDWKNVTCIRLMMWEPCIFYVKSFWLIIVYWQK